MKQTIVKISNEVLRKCVQQGGDLVVELDLDSTQIEHFPQGDEIFLRSKKYDLPENYNHELCLAENQRIVYVHDVPYWLKPAQFKVMKILYEQPEFMLDYIQFACAYADCEKLTSKVANEKVVSAVKHTNNYFRMKNIPLVVKRYNGVVRLEKACEE